MPSALSRDLASHRIGVDRGVKANFGKTRDAAGVQLQFYIDGAAATDVHQGEAGDCWFLTSLMAVPAQKGLIEKLCPAKNEDCGVYGFVFYRDGEWIYEIIDDYLILRVGDDDNLEVNKRCNGDGKRRKVEYDGDKLKEALQHGPLALTFSHCNSDETWLPLIEKAYAKAHGDYTAIEGGYPSEGVEDLTGGVAVVLSPGDIMDKNKFWREQLLQVNQRYLFGGSSRRSDAKGLLGNHAYAVLEAWEEGDLKLLKLRNPWGKEEWNGDWSDGSKLWTVEMMTKLKHTFGDDGVFWMTYKDFLKHFAAINRVRLFDDSWIVGQQWTCINVPWTVDYLDTKFQFTVSERGPVVVVLSQPDDRFFRGLEGRYYFSMHFRVYQQGQGERWFVRSMHNSGSGLDMTRSVSAELDDLQPGTYDVVFKVRAGRSTTSLTTEEVIQKHGIDRKEKLLHVGRRLDYAVSKGNRKAIEEQNKKRQIERERAKCVSSLKGSRKLQLLEKEKAKLRKKRIADALKEKRAAFRAKQREQRHRKRERRKTKQEAAAKVVLQTVGQAELDLLRTLGQPAPTVMATVAPKVPGPGTIAPGTEIKREVAGGSEQATSETATDVVVPKETPLNISGGNQWQSGPRSDLSADEQKPAADLAEKFAELRVQILRLCR